MENQPVQLLLLNPSEPGRATAWSRASSVSGTPRLLKVRSTKKPRRKPKKNPKKQEEVKMARRMTRRKNPKRKNPARRHRRMRFNPKGVPQTEAQKAKAKATREARKGDKALLDAAIRAKDWAAVEQISARLQKPERKSRPRKSSEQKAAEAAEKALRKILKERKKRGEALTEAEEAKIRRKKGAPRAKRGLSLERYNRASAAAELIRTGALSNWTEAQVGPLTVEVVASRGKNKGQKVTRSLKSARSKAASTLSRAYPAKSAERAIASAWRRASKLNQSNLSAEQRRLMRAFGLAEVPNPSMGSMMGDLRELLPQMGVSAVVLAGSAVAGQFAWKALPTSQQSGALGKAAPSLVSASLGVIGYMLARRSPSKAKFAPAILFGGVAAAAVHAIVRVKVGEQTIAQKLGLPIEMPVGEYASMAGYGEYASMAGFGEYASMAGTHHAGERGIFAGLDDSDPVISGTDDEDDVDYTETLADEGVNADEGSLNGSIFD